MIPDYLLLQRLGLVKKINTLYIDFDPIVGTLDNTLDLIQYCESRCAGLIDPTHRYVPEASAAPKHMVFILKLNNRWGFVHQDQIMEGTCHDPILDGLMEFLKSLNYPWIGTISIDSKRLCARVQSIEAWVVAHWRQFDLVEFDQMRQLDAELRRVNLLGAQIHIMYVRKQRHQHLSEYQAPLKLLQA